jgi:hypothetical protein
MTTLILLFLFLVLGLLGAVIGLPASMALFLVGEARVRDGAVSSAYTGLLMLMVSVCGLLWVALV